VAIDATDTLGLSTFGSTAVVYPEAGGAGFIFGTSAVDTFLLDQQQNQIDFKITGEEIAQGWETSGPHNVLGAMMWFGYKVGVNANPGDLQVHLYSMDTDAAVIGTSGNQLVLGPGPGTTREASVALPFNDVNVAPLPNIARTISLFASPVWVSGNFVLSVDLKNLYGVAIDTVALFSQQINGGGSSTGEYTYTKSGADDPQITVTSPWVAASALGAAVDVAIFAIVAESGTSIEEQGYLNGVKMTTYPNPTVSSENFTIQYSLETSVKNVDINIHNMNGQIVHTTALGAKASGLYNLNIPAGTLSAGSYIYSIDADGRRMAKRLEVLK